MKHVAVMLFTTLVAGSGVAAADPTYVIPGMGDSVQEDVSPVMLPQRPRDVIHFIGQQHKLDGSAKWSSAAVNSHIVYMNPCLPNGCHVVTGNDDSTTDHSSLGQGTLTPWSFGQTAWNGVMACMTSTMSRFNITVTDVDPGTAPHFEIMVAGSPGQLGMSQGIGGVAPVPCQAVGQCDAYLPNALVFDFADVWQGDINETCSTAAQEIAHAWILDHVVDKTDPMTYNLYSGMRQFKDGMSCGSDCQGGQSPFGLQCSSSNDATATHGCMSSGQVTQNDLQMIKALFGPSGAIAPTVAITSPANGSTVSTGFKVEATCNTGDGVEQVDLLIDNGAVATLTAPPFSFTTPGSLASGSHTVSVACTTKNQAQASATANITVGSGCSAAAPCAKSTDVCLNGACVAGMDAPGGLGHTCNTGAECTSTMCASDGTDKYCVIACDPMASGQCPTGFTCVNAGASGVCFPGSDGGGGGCLDASGASSGGGAGQGLLMLLGGVGALLVRRRKAA